MTDFLKINLGYHCYELQVYLSTKDKQGFYAKCGYHFCDPVVHIGSAKLPVIKGLAEKAFNETTTDDREVGFLSLF